MKRDELDGRINVIYRPDLGYGLEKIDHPDYENIWFVIPPPLPRGRVYLDAFPRKVVLDLLGKASRILKETRALMDLDEIDLLLLRQEAVASFRIEGIQATIDEDSILGYARAMEEVILKISEEKFASITHDIFRKIHKSIMAPGEYRTPGKPGSIVQIGGLRRKEESTYNPAPPQHVQALMNQFIAWLSDPLIQEEDDAGMGLPLPLRMAIGHAHFEAIHPFTDGNGRVGRMIWPMQMILAGHAPIHLSGFIEANKDGYYDGLKAFQKRLDPLPLLDYLGDALEGSQAEAEQTKAAILKLPQEWKQRLSARRDSAAERLVKHLTRHPVLSAQDVMGLLDVSLPSAVAALKQLEKDGIIAEKSGRQRKQKYAAEEVLAVVGRPYGLSADDAIALLHEKKRRS